MYQLTCSSCGQKVHVSSFLSAAQERCSHCGRPVIGGGDEPPAPQRDPGAGSSVSGPSAKKMLAITGGVVGGLLGAVLVPYIGYHGGKAGPPFAGAVAVATAMCLLILYRAGAIQGVLTGLITGDHCWFNMWMIVLLFVGAAFGMGAGLYVERMNEFLAVFGGLGGAIIGGLGGAIVGPVFGTPEKTHGEETPVGSPS